MTDERWEVGIPGCAGAAHGGAAFCTCPDPVRVGDGFGGSTHVPSGKRRCMRDVTKAKYDAWLAKERKAVGLAVA